MLCFLLLKTQSLSVSGRMEGEKEIGEEKKAVEVKRNGKIWLEKKKKSSEYWRHLRGLNGFTYRYENAVVKWDGERNKESAVLLFCLSVYVQVCSCFCTPAIHLVSRFRSTLSPPQLPSPLLSHSLLFVIQSGMGRGGICRKVIHILSQAISWVQMLLCSQPLEEENG